MLQEKNKNILKNILIVVFIIIICVSNIFGKSYTNFDEIWNFNFARNISNGLVPYKDFNMIQTPLLSILCGIVLKIFGQELFVMRIMAVMMLSAIFIISYVILRKITNKEIAILGLLAFLFLFKDIMCIDYNYAILLVSLILTLVEIIQKDEDFYKCRFKYDFLLGILAGSMILFKQTTGIAVAMAFVGYKIFKIRKKEDMQEFLKIACTRMLGVIIPVVLFILYLVINGAVKDFVDYAVLGIKTFSNKILYSKLLAKKQLVSLLAIMVPITILVLFVSMFSKKAKKENYILFAFGISSSIVIYPISDNIHFYIGSLITFIGGIYFSYEYLREAKFLKKRIVKVTLYGMTSFLMMFLCLTDLFGAVKNFNENYIKVNKESELAHFKGIPERRDAKETILAIDDYIKEERDLGKKVYVLDASAALYMIPLDIYNKNYDMFILGNLGKDGEDGEIKKLQNTKEDIVFLVKGKNINWQTPIKVRDYVVDNYDYLGSICGFYVFENYVDN